MLLGCVTCLYLPLIFAGPGADPDSIRELRSGTILLRHHVYVLSRAPGYFPYEALCGLLYSVTGSTIVTNLATVLMSLYALDSFLAICGNLKVPHRYLLTLTMALHPVYWANSTSTIDFIWALGCFLIGFRLLLSDRIYLAGAMLGLAIGIRLSSVLLVGALLSWFIVERPRDKKLRTAAAITAAFGAALYFPEFRASGYSFRFLTYYLGNWGLLGEIGRFLYKNVYFWGLPASVYIATLCPRVVRELLGCDREFVPIIILSLSIVGLFEALFLKIPVQRAYLLPMLPFALILLGIALRNRERALIAIAILIASFNVANLNLARPDVPDNASSVRFGLFIEPGYLVEDLRARRVMARFLMPSLPHRQN